MKLLKLENRIVLDAAAVIEAAQHTASLPVAPPSVDSQPLEVVADQQQPVVADVVAALSFELASSDGLNIALVANNLNNYTELTDSLTAQGVTVITFDTQTDSSEAVLQRVEALALQQHSSIRSLSVVSHGGGGYFALGNELVSADTLAQEGSAWSALSDNFSANSAVYLFGCNVVDGSGRGQALLDSLSGFTGSNIFASNDLTGVGGDWILESSSAGADAQLITPDSRMLSALSGFEGTLANTPPVVVVPGAQSVNEDLVLSVTGISVSDPNVTPAQEAVRVVEVTLNVTNLNGVTVSNGLLTLNQSVNLTFTPSAVGVVSNGIADSQMSFLGSITDVNAALASLSFQGALNFNGDLQIHVSVNDRGNIDTAIDPLVDPNQIGQFLTTSSSFGVTIVPVNDVPVNTVPVGVQAAVEDVPLVFNATGVNINPIQVSDVDANGAPLLVTLAATNGTVSLSGVAGLTLVNGTGAGDASVTFSGTAAAINAALDGVSFTSNPNFVGGGSLSITTNDQNLGAQGLGGAGIVTSVVNIGVSGVNDAPVNNLPTAALTVVEDTPLVMTVASNSAIQISDVDIGSGLAKVTLSVDSGALSLAQITGLTFSVGGGAANASMTFSGTVADVNAALDGLIYAPAANFNGPANLQISTNDLNNAGLQGSGGALTTVNNLLLNVTSVNDAPVYTVPIVQNIAEDGSLVLSVANNNAIVVSDVDAGINPLQVTLTAANGSLTLASTAGLTLTAGTGVADGSVTFTGTVTAINAALDGLQFAAAPNFTGNTQILLAVNDQNNGNQGGGGALGSNSAVDLVVAPLNDAPVNTVPVAQSTNEDIPLVFSSANANAIQVSDVDIAGAPMQVTLTATSGTLTLAQTTGLSFQSGTGSNNLSMTFTGTVTDINLALEGMQFSPIANFNGGASLQIVSNDLNAGAQGFGGALSASSTVAITVNAVNDAPVNAVPVAQSTNEDTALIFSNANGNALQVSDVDLGGNPIMVTLTVDSGALSLAQTTGLTFTAGSGSAAPSMSFSGSVSAVNAALNGLGFTPGANFNGAVQLQVTSSDGVLTTNDVVAITVNAVNDAPVLTVPGLQSVNEDTDLPISGISISDVDVGSGAVLVTLSAGSGVLSLNQTTGLVFAVGTGSQDSTMTFSGTLVDVNAALQSLVFYRPNLNFSGTDTIALSVDDQGNGGAGAGAALIDNATITVNVNAVNDAPVLTLPAAQTVAEEGVLSLNTISVADVDVGAGLLEVTLTLGGAQTAGHGTLALAGTTGLNFAPGSAANGSSMTFSGSLIDINAALGTLTYTGDLNFNGSDRLNISVNDGGSSGSGGPLSDSGSVAIEVTPVNDAPVLTLPGTLAVNEDVVVAITGVSVADVDAGIAPLSMTLSANNGSLSLGVVSGLSFAPGSTASGSSITFSGSSVEMNAALATLSYQGNLNFFGTDSITVSVDDQGAGGSGGALIDSRVIDVLVSPQNDAPSFTLSVAALSYREGDLPIVLDAGLTLVDVDNANLQSASVTLGNLQQGDLLAFTSSANVAGSYDAATGVLTLTADPVLGASATDFQTALQSVTYVNTLNTVPVGLRPVTFSATDGIDTGGASLTLSVTNGFTAVTPSVISPVGTVTPADPRPPLNGIQTATGGLTSIPSSSINLLGGINLSTGQLNSPQGTQAPQGAQFLSAPTAEPSQIGSSTAQFLSLQNVQAGGDAFRDECSLDKIFKRVDMGCRFAEVKRGFENSQYLSVASGQEAGWNYPMSGENQGLIDQLAVGEGVNLGLNQDPGDFAAAYLGDRSLAPVEGNGDFPATPQPLPEATGSVDEAVDNAVKLFDVEPAAGATVNIQPLAPLSDADLGEMDPSRSDGELILEDEPMPTDAELSRSLDANVQILGRAANLLDKGSLG